METLEKINPADEHALVILYAMSDAELHIGDTELDQLLEDAEVQAYHLCDIYKIERLRHEYRARTGKISAQALAAALRQPTFDTLCRRLGHRGEKLLRVLEENQAAITAALPR